MKTTLLLAVALFTTATAFDIKERLRQLRDPANVNPENMVFFVNDRHERRMEKLAELLDERQKQLQDHEAGHRKLSSEDHARVTRQAINFERKLAQLENTDRAELADMMQHEADSLYKLNSVDYLDFELKK